MKPITIVIIVVIVLGLLSGAGYYGYQSSQAQDANIPQAPPTVAVTTCDVQSSVTATGDLVNTNQVTLQMPATGQLAEVSVHPGDHVSKGQVLANLTDREKFTTAVTSAQLALAQARQDYQALIDNATSAAAQAQLDVANAQIAVTDAQKKVAAANYPHSTDPLVIEKAQTDYLLAKAAYKDALSAYRDVAHKKLTNPERVQALSRLVAAEADMKTKFATYNWYLLGYTDTEVAQADAELAVAQANLEKAQADWDLVKDNDSSAAVMLAEAKLADAQRAYERVKDGPSQAEIDAAQAAVDAAQAAADLAQPGAGEMGRYWSGLAGTLTARAAAFGDPADLQRAIRYGRAATAATGRADPRYAGRMDNLAGALIEWRQRPGDLVEDRGDDRLDVALIEVRICLGEALNEL